MAESNTSTVELVRQRVAKFSITATPSDGYSDDNMSFSSAETNRIGCWNKNVASQISGRRQRRRSPTAKIDVSANSLQLSADKRSFLVEYDISDIDSCTSATSCTDVDNSIKSLSPLNRKTNKRRGTDNNLEDKAVLEKFVELSNKVDAIRRSKRKGKLRRPPLAQYFTHSASNGSLTSLNSSTSSGIDTADGTKSATSRNNSSNELFFNDLQQNYKENISEERGNMSSPIPVSSTSSSIGFADDDMDEPRIRSVESMNSANSCSSDEVDGGVKSLTTERSDKERFNCDNANLFTSIDSATETFAESYPSTPDAFHNNNNLIHIPLTYYPIMLNNFNVMNQKQQQEISPLLSNPNVEKFYNEQREYYRRIYDKQFATCGFVVLKEKPYSLKLDNKKWNAKFCNNITSDEASTSTEVDHNVMSMPQSATATDAAWKHGYANKFGYPFGKKSFPKLNNRYYKSHKHLGYPIRLPYAALASWNTLGLKNPYYEQQLNEDSKPQIMKQMQHNTIENSSVVYNNIENRWNADRKTSEPSTINGCVNEAKLNQTSYKPIKDESSKQHESSDPATMANFCASSYCPNDVGNSRCNVDGMDSLADQIMEFHQSVEQQPSTLGRKLNLRDMLYHTIAPIFPMCGLYIVGSSLNGFGNNKSDMDLCLMITNRDIDQRSDAVIVLQSIMRTLQTTSFVANQQLILAKVPILRINFHSAFSDITVDLNANNSVAIRNTHLLCYYSSFDWRVRPLVAIVKEWAKRRGINDANRSSFTSYSLVLMVIHYLQCGTVPPVLPSLQQLYPKCFNQRADVRHLNVSMPLNPPPSTLWDFNDRLTLGELLIGFFQYYAFSFNFDADAISIRLGRKTERALVARNRSPYNHLSQWHCICIEEPFTFSNTAHSVYDERIFDSIKKSFIDGFHQLETNHDLHAFLASSDNVQDT